MQQLDLLTTDLTDVNRRLQGREGNVDNAQFQVTNAVGTHALAAGLMHSVDVLIQGHVGYYCGGMNQLANITIEGNAGTGVAENMMSGTVRVRGDVSQSAGATGHGGLLIVEGDAAARCGISMKGIDIVVVGSVGHMAAFMAQAGRLVVCGDAGPYLGDSIYEADIFVRGTVASLGADCEEKTMEDDEREALSELLRAASVDCDPNEFRRYGSARSLYHFKVDNASSY
ncbi:MAG: hypothetical protein AAF493_28710 [Pseudomonadota bacterium]